MEDIKLYQSSKYRTSRYMLEKFIYYKDKQDGLYCLPMMGYLEKLDNMNDIIKILCSKFDVKCDYTEEIIIDNEHIALFELKGTIANMILASNIISKKIIPIYVNGIIYDIYIE